MRCFLFLFASVASPPSPPDAVDISKPCFLYILESLKVCRYYIGISSNPHRRLEYHNTVERGFTSRYRPWRLLYVKEYPSKAEAHAAEAKVKGWKSRKMIEQLLRREVSV
ncbi:MAG: GIY-YIG nuclease family protein [Chlorobiaceae bacterium]|nr:GIY-YIG nuclease family protein [Chlorobiaceae bacterium]